MKTSTLGLLRRYISFRRHCSKRHGFGVHSPYVFDLLTKVIEPDERQNFVFFDIANYRRMLKNHGGIINREPVNGEPQTPISVRSLAKQAAVPAHLGRLLYRLCQHVQPKNVVELGTSLGVSTLYLATGASKGMVHSIEADSQVLSVTEEGFKIFKCSNIRIYKGTFAQQLPPLLKQLKQVDMVFVDGHHQGEALLNYLDMIIPCTTDTSMVIIDDIRWSDDMEEAWRKACADERVSISIDLFRCGLLLFRKGIVKQHFNLRYGPY